MNNHAETNKRISYFHLRGLLDWSYQNQLTCHIGIIIDAQTILPLRFAKEETLILNISFTAIKKLVLDDDGISFFAKFGGKDFQVFVPMDNIKSFILPDKSVELSLGWCANLDQVFNIKTANADIHSKLTPDSKKPNLKLASSKNSDPKNDIYHKNIVQLIEPEKNKTTDLQDSNNHNADLEILKKSDMDEEMSQKLKKEERMKNFKVKFSVIDGGKK